jgi:hypothetical protein
VATKIANKLEGLPVEAKNWALNTWRIRRFIDGNKGDVDKAADQLAWCVAYRSQLRVWHIQASDVREELCLGSFYCRATDLEGHPVIVYRCCRSDHTLCPDLRMRALILCLDHLEARLDQGDFADDSKWVLILDMIGKPHKGSASADYFIRVTRTFVKCYPERLFCLFILDASYVFRTIWDMACKTKLIQVETAQKVCFCSRHVMHGQQMVPELVGMIGEDGLEEEYGGYDDFIWNAELHWNVLDLAPASLLKSAKASACDAELTSTKDETRSTDSGGTSWFSIQSAACSIFEADLEAQMPDTSSRRALSQVVTDCQALRGRLVHLSVPKGAGSADALARLSQLSNGLDRFLSGQGQLGTQGKLPKSSMYEIQDDYSSHRTDWRRLAERRFRSIVFLGITVLFLVIALIFLLIALEGAC